MLRTCLCSSSRHSFQRSSVVAFMGSRYNEQFSFAIILSGMPSVPAAIKRSLLSVGLGAVPLAIQARFSKPSVHTLDQVTVRVRAPNESRAQYAEAEVLGDLSMVSTPETPNRLVPLGFESVRQDRLTLLEVVRGLELRRRDAAGARRGGLTRPCRRRIVGLSELHFHDWRCWFGGRRHPPHCACVPRIRDRLVQMSPGRGGRGSPSRRRSQHQQRMYGSRLTACCTSG